MSKLAAKFLLLLIHIYQKALSPIFPARCRYYPTCSDYGRLALLWHGPCHGLALTTNRVLRCHPFGGQGIDFVPLPLYQDIFVAITSTSNASTSRFCDNAATYDYSSQPHNNPFLEQKISVNGHSTTCNTHFRLPERGVYADRSSYSARLNHRLNQL